MLLGRYSLHTPVNTKNDNMKISIVIAGTHSYLNVAEPCIRRAEAALYHARQRRDIEAVWIGVTDKEGEKQMSAIMPEGSVIKTIGMTEGGTRYKEASQILIANLQQVGFRESIKQNVDKCWIVEPDVLVPHNALSCMMDMLEFDDGYYDVAFVTYPSQSGGAFLGGYGDPCHPIAEDFLPEERDVPEVLQKKIDSLKKKMEAFNKETPKDEVDGAMTVRQMQMEEVKKCPPKGNVFELNAKGWRRRGWLDNAHPAIGRGAVLETDWTGLGCNLLSRRALASASFDGYDGNGTQDLFLNWRRWKADGLRFCVITHTVCEHVVSANDGDRKVHAFAHHEPQGEFRGHLRVQHRPYYSFNGNDTYDPGNSGIISQRPN